MQRGECVDSGMGGCKQGPLCWLSTPRVPAQQILSNPHEPARAARFQQKWRGLGFKSQFCGLSWMVKWLGRPRSGTVGHKFIVATTWTPEQPDPHYLSTPTHPLLSRPIVSDADNSSTPNEHIWGHLQKGLIIWGTLLNPCRQGVSNPSSNQRSCGRWWLWWIVLCL